MYIVLIWKDHSGLTLAAALLIQGGSISLYLFEVITTSHVLSS